MARLLSIEYPGFEKLNFFGGTTRRIHLGFDTAADVMYLNKVAYKKLTNVVSIFASLMLIHHIEIPMSWKISYSNVVQGAKHSMMSHLFEPMLCGSLNGFLFLIITSGFVFLNFRIKAHLIIFVQK